MVPEWATYGNLTVGIAYSKGHGLVDNISLAEADMRLVVSVVSDGAPIRQVKIMDENRKLVFDSGLMDGCRSWVRRIPLESAIPVKVYAVDAVGDVATAAVK